MDLAKQYIYEKKTINQGIFQVATCTLSFAHFDQASSHTKNYILGFLSTLPEIYVLLENGQGTLNLVLGLSALWAGLSAAHST